MRGPKPAITLYYGTAKLVHHRYPVPDGADAWLSAPFWLFKPLDSTVNRNHNTYVVSETGGSLFHLHGCTGVPTGCNGILWPNNGFQVCYVWMPIRPWIAFVTTQSIKIAWYLSGMANAVKTIAVHLPPNKWKKVIKKSCTPLKDTNKNY